MSVTGHPTIRPRGVRRRDLSMIAVLLLLLAGLGLVFGAPGAAVADVPETPVAEPFLAPLCEGETDEDPTAASIAALTDLREVFGQRLVDYNAGRIVMLYDSIGSNDADYPPICGTRHVAGIGPVSEWMYCTDIDARACAITNVDGEREIDGVVLPPLTDVGANPRLSPEQERIIAYLVRYGHPFVGSTPSFAEPGAASNATTAQRDALQYLIWCVSDGGRGIPALDEVCAANMDAAEQARILALVPETAVLGVDLSDRETGFEVGETATLTLQTNVYGQPLRVVAPGGTVTVCGGPATLVDGLLTVSGTDPAVTAEVDLCVTAAAPGAVSISVTATPPSTEHLSWNRSVTAEVFCQVFATFQSDQLADVADTAEVTFVAAPDPDGSETPAPVESPDPDDSETPTPEPTDTETPAPYPVDPEPTDTQSPGPTDSETPAPVEAREDGDLGVTGSTPAVTTTTLIGAALGIVGLGLLAHRRAFADD